MVIYHFIWDLVFLFDFEIDWFHSDFAFIWQQSICHSFILLSGFSFKLGKRPLKRGVNALIAGGAVTISTFIANPSAFVNYGVLTFIGTAIILFIPFDRILKSISPEWGIISSLLIFYSVYFFLDKRPFKLPSHLLGNKLLTEALAFSGFPQKGFYSLDYFPLLPWIFLFAAGYFIYCFFKKEDILKELLNVGHLPLLNYLGKHSLFIYIVHQPVCYALGFLMNLILK